MSQERKLPNEDREAFWVTPDRKKVIRFIATVEKRPMTEIADEMADLYMETKKINPAEVLKMIESIQLVKA